MLISRSAVREFRGEGTTHSVDECQSSQVIPNQAMGFLEGASLIFGRFMVIESAGPASEWVHSRQLK